MSESVRTFSWREVVESVDGEKFHVDSLYPVVYEFSNGRKFRDSGPQSGIYDPTP